MKKTILCLILALCFLLSACASVPVTDEPVAEQPSDAAVQTPAENAPEQVPSEPAATVEAPVFKYLYDEMLAAEVLPEMMEFPESMVLDFYGIEEADYDQAIFYQSYDSMLADEVVLISAVDDAAASRVEEMLNARLEAKAEEAKGYSPEQFAIIEKCSVVREGEFVALIVSPEKDTLVEIFKNGIA